VGISTLLHVRSKRSLHEHYTLVSTIRFSSIIVFIDNLKKFISLYQQGITVPVHNWLLLIHQTLMSVYNTTMI